MSPKKLSSLSYFARGTAPKTVEAHNAQQRVYDALKRGEIKRPLRCSACGEASKDIQFAHDDYTNRLSGKWLCPSCHARYDNARPKGGGNGRAGTERAQ